MLYLLKPTAKPCLQSAIDGDRYEMFVKRFDKKTIVDSASVVKPADALVSSGRQPDAVGSPILTQVAALLVTPETTNRQIWLP